MHHVKGSHRSRTVSISDRHLTLHPQSVTRTAARLALPNCPAYLGLGSPASREAAVLGGLIRVKELGHRLRHRNGLSTHNDMC